MKTSLKAGSGEIEKVDLSNLEILCNKEYGSVKLFQKLYKKYFGKLLKSKNYSKALEAIIINKIFDPKSKNSISNWISKVDLGYDIKNKNDLYESLDYIEEQKEKIEKSLVYGLRKQECSILLYDTVLKINSKIRIKNRIMFNNSKNNM